MNRYTILLFIACIGLWNCSDDYNNPGGIIPPEDLINAVFTDTTTIIARIDREDTVRTDGGSRVLLGSYYDPTFGRTTSSFYTTLNVSQKQKGFGTNPVVDSVVLRLRHDGDYGDVSKFNSYQVAEVFEVIQDIPIINLDSTQQDGYNSYTSFAYNHVPLGVKGFAPKYAPYKNEGAQFQIRLNNSFGERFLAQDSLMPNEIVNLCKGLYVRISPSITQSQAPGQGGISYFLLSSDISRVSIHFHNDESTQGKELRLVTSGDNNSHFSVFTHDYASSTDPSFTAQVNDTSVTGQSLYIQSIEGFRVKLRLPYLMSYVDTQKVILHKAELIIPVDFAQDLIKYPVAPNILPYNLSGEGLIQVFSDFPYGYFDSKYDPVAKQYRVLITQYLQQVLTGEKQNLPIYLKFTGGFLTQYFPKLVDASDAYRAVINSPDHATLPMKLNLTYTRVYTQ